MSVYRKTKTGQLVKVAGYNVQKLNDKMFYAVHSYSQDNLTEYYDITAAAELYMSKFVDYSQFTVYSDVPNTTTNAYLKLDNQLLRIYDENGPVAVGKFDGKLDCYIVQVNDSKVQFVNDLAILTKVDKSSSNNILYGTNESGQQTVLTYGTNSTANIIVQRDLNGQIVVPQTPTDNTHASSKKYVDDLLTNNAVKYSSAQSLNSTQQAQARTNIGAGTPATLISINNVPTYTLAFASDPQTQINGKQASLNANQLLAVNSGITTTLVTQISTNQGNISTNTSDISDIKLVIPSDATSLNPLVTEGRVTQLLQTMSAHFRGNWTNWSVVPTTAASYPLDDDGNRTPTTNDYMVVQNASDYTLETLVGCWRFKYSGTWSTNGKSGWHPEYQINETPLTTEQLAALNSGITASLVTQIGTNQTNIGTIQTTMITNVSFDNQTNKLQKTINNNTTDIVTFGSNAFNSTTIPASAADLGIVLTTTAGSEAITVGSNTLSFGSNAFNSTPIPSAVTSVNGLSGGTISSATNIKGTLSVLDSNNQVACSIDQNGDINGRYLKGTWLYTSGATEDANWTDVFVNNGGWLYKRSKANIKSDLGVPSTYVSSVNGSSGAITNIATINDLLNKIYPVGSVYLSVSQTSPASFLGGTWEALSSDKALWTTTAANTGGNTLSAQLPNIKGTISFGRSIFGEGTDTTDGSNSALTHTMTQGGSKQNLAWNGTNRYGTLNFNASNSNSTYTDNGVVRPASIRVYAWKRTA